MPLPEPGHEYAECPECLHVGPHIIQGEDLECVHCYAVFLNPHR